MRLLRKEHLVGQGASLEERLRCNRCGDVIGTYEPMVVLADGQARETAKAAEQDIARSVGECYHHACYTQTHGEHPVT
jgi:hypothetical protein